MTSVKYLLVGLLLITVRSGFAHDHSSGVHGMVLMSVGERLLASHMPLHNGKHAVQVVLELSVEGNSHTRISRMLNEQRLVTLAPEVFSLSELRSGRLKQFQGTIFNHHFERNGQVVIEDVLFKVKRLLLNRALVVGDNGGYYVVDVGSQQVLLVHKIGKLPSFDQIVLVSHASDKTFSNQNNQIRMGNALPLDGKNAVMVKFGFKFEKQLYLETQDFSK